MKEKKARVDDALNATRATMAEGVVAGGGVALLRSRSIIDGLLGSLEGDEALGARIVRAALERPVRQISENAGMEGAIVVNQLDASDDSMGYNARTNEYVDMFEAGVIDPVKVTRNALQNAGSIAGLVMTTETLVADIPVKEDVRPTWVTWAAWVAWAAWAAWASEHLNGRQRADPSPTFGNFVLVATRRRRRAPTLH